MCVEDFCSVSIERGEKLVNKDRTNGESAFAYPMPSTGHFSINPNSFPRMLFH